MPRRFALLIANSEYDHPCLKDLRSPESDVSRLASLLLDENIGAYEVETLVNSDSACVRLKISEFFRTSKKGDLRVLYYSGHGIKDDRGRLYLATRDSKVKFLAATSIPSEFVTREMDESVCEKQIIVLDCCHAGAVVRDTKSPAGNLVGMQEQFEGRGTGRIILAASDAFEYALDRDKFSPMSDQEAPTSLYTKFLIEGLEDGRADEDKDGIISVFEIAKYIEKRMEELGAAQTPKRFILNANGEIEFSKSPVEGSAPRLARCYVISPISGHDGRPDEVLQKLVRPACEQVGFKAVRSDFELSAQILPEVLAALRSDPMVIAYLGKPPWNANVMIEVGFRLATGRAMVLLRDSKDSNRLFEPPLPFDLNDHRVLFLPTSEQMDQGKEVTDLVVKQIAEVLQERSVRHSTWETPHAVADIKVNLDERSGYFSYASYEADHLFDEVRGLRDKTLIETFDKIRPYMPQEQYDAFLSEQEELLKHMNSPALFSAGSRQIPIAKYPIVFKNHPKEIFNGKSYLPIIVQYSRQGSELWLKVLYLDVTSVAEPDENHIYHCALDIAKHEPRLLEAPPAIDLRETRFTF